MEMEELRKQLEDAIGYGDSYLCSRVVGEMLNALEPREALQIALNQVSEYFLTFEKLHPEESWVRRWFELSSRFEPMDHAHLGSGHSFYRPPGEDDASRAYLYGLAELDIAFEKYFEQRPDVVLGAAGDAIGYIGAAKFSTYLWETAPIMMAQYDEIAKSKDESVSEERAGIVMRIVMNFRESPERQYFIEHFWNEIADEIASKLVE